MKVVYSLMVTLAFLTFLALITGTLIFLFLWHTIHAIIRLG